MMKKSEYFGCLLTGALFGALFGRFSSEMLADLGITNKWVLDNGFLLVACAITAFFGLIIWPRVNRYQRMNSQNGSAQ